MIPFILVAVAYALAQYFDGRYTRRAYEAAQTDLVEWNPMVRPFIKSDLAMFAFKGAFTAVTLSIAYAGLHLSVLWPCAIIGGLAVANGLAAIHNRLKAC